DVPLGPGEHLRHRGNPGRLLHRYAEPGEVRHRAQPYRVDVAQVVDLAALYPGGLPLEVRHRVGDVLGRVGRVQLVQVGVLLAGLGTVVVGRVAGQQPLVVVRPAGRVGQVLGAAGHPVRLDVALDEQRVEPGRVAEAAVPGDPVVGGEPDRGQVRTGRRDRMHRRGGEAGRRRVRGHDRDP